ncbi:glycosyl transferase family 1 [Bacillus thuringiensis]|uniref:Glycosyl transferase family 1 n=1 Tax=Bacillus thuringiensis TaxID=1428 RepID=A0A9X6YHS0_BACTU|nr:glycosyltransferase family 1 protein [Bacillus thuringiensis]HDR8126618.1 glycosyltransferase family 1 protein [Bacillus cereus]PED15490.1 glycosyl transferase family 1 [Bacillus thuringiensis]PES36414.1 glycosyl transferase family 1 [Bacillus thuringiensis]PFC33262.1 glycosyl transferase family 1 [Bacillus thuringiensis]PFD59315.1 glycosyl transferase family 1 [Bacillus thuringiensis]
MGAPIRILQVFNSMNRGGAESMIMNLYRQVDKTKVQFDFVVHTSNSCAFDDEIKQLGGNIYYIPRFKGYNYLSYRKEWIKFFNIHKEYKVIHGHIGSCAAIYLQIAKEYGLYTIAHSHSTKKTTKKIKTPQEILFPVFSYPTRFIADYFFGCSKLAGKYRYGDKIVASDRFEVINNAVRTQDYIFNEDIRIKYRNEFNLKDQFVIIHVGRFDVPKNQTYLIDIFKEYHKVDESSILVLVGEGPLKKVLEEKVKALNLQESVIFTGIRNDVPDLLKMGDVFVFPSIYEGLPVTLIEAQATGLKCIVSDTVTEEVKVTNLVEFVGLSEPIDSWLQKISAASNSYSRVDRSNDLAISGYDIKETAVFLEDFYINRHNNDM